MPRHIGFLAILSLCIGPIAILAPNTPVVEPAATVNGEAIPKVALERALNRLPEEQRLKARGEILDFLIDNVIVDQYLGQMKITVEDKEVQARLDEMKEELKKSSGGQTLEKLLQSLSLTEAEFREQIGHDLRWEKFCLQQSTDANLKALFDKHPDMFDGSLVRARHILIAAGNDEKSQAAAVAELTRVKKHVEEVAAQALAKLPAAADALRREQERGSVIEEAFASAAKEKSICPSKRDGGDVNWFPRAGNMVEAFAKAAFALKPYEMSEPVKTQFGYHLILVTGRKPGQEVKFDEVKEAVREVYCSQLREAICSKYRPAAKIVIGK
jgi:peptidyl-prolyl cis-trans isomerase C